MKDGSMKYVAIILAAAGAGFLLVSCGGPVSSGVVLERALKTHQSDIPVPLEYRYLADKSRVEVFSSFRLCELVYEGPPDAAHGVQAVKRFYETFMPRYGWNRVEWKVPRNVLIFKKQGKRNEYCRVEIYRNRSVTTIYILVGNKKLVTAE